jgi:hypothetical protein
VTKIAEVMARETADQRSLVYDIFHTLSQPMTALQCSLELALARDRTAEDLRASVEAALENVERLRQSFLLLRELNDADDPGDISAPVELRQLLLELQEDFLPVFESTGGRLILACGPLQVRGNAPKLRRAFFCLIEYLWGGSTRPSLSLRVKQGKNRRVEVRITFSSQGSVARAKGDLCETVAAGEVEIARRTFRAVGGDLTLVSLDSEQNIWIASLQLAGLRPSSRRRISSIS